MSHGPNIPHNPLRNAASQAMHAARETRSPALEKLAIATMIGSAVVSTGLGVAQVVRMIQHDREKAEERAYQRLKREQERERAEANLYTRLKRDLDAQERNKQFFEHQSR